MDNNATRFKRKQITRFNDYLCASDFTLGEKLIIPLYCRIFADSFDQGGRFYDGSYQNLKKSIRSQIKIDGSDTQEADFSELHSRRL